MSRWQGTSQSLASIRSAAGWMASITCPFREWLSVWFPSQDTFRKGGTQQKDEPCKSFDLKLSGRKYRRCFCRVILGRPSLCKGRSAGHGLVAVLHQTSASNINVDNHNGRTQRINGFWALCSGPILVYLKRSRKLSRSFPRTT